MKTAKICLVHSKTSVMYQYWIKPWPILRMSIHKGTLEYNNEVFMLRFISALCLAALISQPAFSQTKKLNTQLYEKEADGEKDKSFTAKVRVVREISDEIEVFFESDEAKGAYSLPKGTHDYATALKKLEKSRAPHGPAATVTVDSEKRIKSVQIQEAPAGKSSKPYDPNYIPDI